MCYDLKVSLERQLKVARNFGDKASIAEIEKKLLPYLNPIEGEYYRISGFDHPRLLIMDEHHIVKEAEWGLVPNWISSIEDYKAIRNKTLNARVEELTEKPSFREAYSSRRGVLFIDGFYEFHHRAGQTFPYFISSASKDYLTIACLYEEALPQYCRLPTFSIITTKANEVMAEIHNNPKLSEPRMPLLLNDKEIEVWLNEPELLIKPGPKVDLLTHTVRRFSKRKNNGNLPDADEEFIYPELSKGLFD